jgi:hypothetical protein
LFADWRRKQEARNVHFDLSRGCVSKGRVEKAAQCERANWRKMARKGDCHIGDRNYGRDYKTLLEMTKRTGRPG